MIGKKAEWRNWKRYAALRWMMSQERTLKICFLGNSIPDEKLKPAKARAEHVNIDANGTNASGAAVKLTTEHDGQTFTGVIMPYRE